MYIKNCYQIASSTKYLGITIDQHLTWTDHINEICNKANITKAFLKRNIHQCPISIKANCYKSLVRPFLEYAAVWSPHLQYRIHQLEKVQHCAACFVMNDYARYSSITNMLNYLSWATLEQRRNLIFFFKIVHGIVDIITLTLTPLDTITRAHHLLTNYLCCILIIEVLPSSYH